MVRHQCETQQDIIKHLEREELLHICYSYGPTVWVWKSAWKRFSLFRIFCCGRFHQFVVLAIFTNKSNDSGCHWASSLYNVEKDETHGLHSTDCSFFHCSGGGRWRATGWSQPLTSPSPSAPEVRHLCTGRLNVATPPLWSSSSPRAPPWMLWTKEARGAGNGRWGRQGMEWRDDLMQSEWKNKLGLKLFDDFECAMCTQLWQDKTNRCYLLQVGLGFCESSQTLWWDLASDDTWGDKATEHIGIHWHLWDAPSRQRYNTNCPHAMTTFDNTFSAWRW